MGLSCTFVLVPCTRWSCLLLQWRRNFLRLTIICSSTDNRLYLPKSWTTIAVSVHHRVPTGDICVRFAWLSFSLPNACSLSRLWDPKSLVLPSRASAFRPRRASWWISISNSRPWLATSWRKPCSGRGYKSFLWESMSDFHALHTKLRTCGLIVKSFGCNFMYTFASLMFCMMLFLYLMKILIPVLHTSTLQWWNHFSLIDSSFPFHVQLMHSWWEKSGTLERMREVKSKHTNSKRSFVRFPIGMALSSSVTISLPYGG